MIYYIQEVIIRLVPDLKSEIDTLVSSTITNDSDILDVLRLEKEMEKNNQHISTVSQKLITNRGVVITGSTGCGKSVAAHHAALTFEKEGYEIIPCEEPSEIIMHFITEKIQVFVIDDICGKFALNQHKADSWEQIDGKLNMLIESSRQKDDKDDSSNKSKNKFTITCRRIYIVTKHSQN
ncbi:unnamed protein product [Mytilus edulis]|uniref:Novel STAND NTPase 3 domain-containing protein n=1 Tax=Mytilus edulis TaxID=6550 RepID=A0A8S3TKK5_MYTED|nr:unnamed protein product [Mytilus edulis]